MSKIKMCKKWQDYCRVDLYLAAFSAPCILFCQFDFWDDSNKNQLVIKQLVVDLMAINDSHLTLRRFEVFENLYRLSIELKDALEGNAENKSQQWDLFEAEFRFKLIYIEENISNAFLSELRAIEQLEDAADDEFRILKKINFVEALGEYIKSSFREIYYG